MPLQMTVQLYISYDRRTTYVCGLVARISVEYGSQIVQRTSNCRKSDHRAVKYLVKYSIHYCIPKEKKEGGGSHTVAA